MSGDFHVKVQFSHNDIGGQNCFGQIVVHIARNVKSIGPPLNDLIQRKSKTTLEHVAIYCDQCKCQIYHPSKNAQFIEMAMKVARDKLKLEQDEETKEMQKQLMGVDFFKK